jgi:hypothetical protein
MSDLEESKEVVQDLEEGKQTGQDLEESKQTGQEEYKEYLEESKEVVQDLGIFTKQISDDCEMVIINTEYGFTIESNKSQIENIIKNNKLNIFDIRITLNNINEDIEKIISEETKIDQTNFYDLCDLVVLNYIYTYLKDGTKIPIL